MSKKRVRSLHPPPSVKPPPSGERPKNRLLALLALDDFRRLAPLLRTAPIRAKQILQKNGAPYRQVYFLSGGVASITTTLSDGTMVEAATVGDEGMLGMEVFSAPLPLLPATP